MLVLFLDIFLTFLNRWPKRFFRTVFLKPCFCNIRYYTFSHAYRSSTRYGGRNRVALMFSECVCIVKLKSEDVSYCSLCFCFYTSSQHETLSSIKIKATEYSQNGQNSQNFKEEIKIGPNMLRILTRAGGVNYTMAPKNWECLDWPQKLLLQSHPESIVIPPGPCSGLFWIHLLCLSSTIRVYWVDTSQLLA